MKSCGVRLQETPTEEVKVLFLKPKENFYLKDDTSFLEFL